MHNSWPNLLIYKEFVKFSISLSPLVVWLCSFSIVPQLSWLLLLLIGKMRASKQDPIKGFAHRPSADPIVHHDNPFPSAFHRHRLCYQHHHRLHYHHHLRLCYQHHYRLHYHRHRYHYHHHHRHLMCHEHLQTLLSISAIPLPCFSSDLGHVENKQVKIEAEIRPFMKCRSNSSSLCWSHQEKWITAVVVKL